MCSVSNYIKILTSLQKKFRDSHSISGLTVGKKIGLPSKRPAMI